MYFRSTFVIKRCSNTVCTIFRSPTVSGKPRTTESFSSWNAITNAKALHKPNESTYRLSNFVFFGNHSGFSSFFVRWIAGKLNKHWPVTPWKYINWWQDTKHKPVYANFQCFQNKDTSGPWTSYNTQLPVDHPMSQWYHTGRTKETLKCRKWSPGPCFSEKQFKLYELFRF